MKKVLFYKKIQENKFNGLLRSLYGKGEVSLSAQKERYMGSIDSFGLHFPDREDVRMFSASGRTEIGGNHTDHQRGVVLGAAVNLDIIAVVSFHEDGIVRVKSEGFGRVEIPLCDLSPREEDSGSSLIIKGILKRFEEKGVAVKGFDMYCTSDVISGGGISSSAAFETLVSTVVDCGYNGGGSTPLEIAKIGKFAENVYFGKKCGMLDQTITSFGGVVSVDFKDSENPRVEKIEFDFSGVGYAICITDTGASHENLTAEYDAIVGEMCAVAAFFGCDVLGEVDEDVFYESIPKLRERFSERAILRAMHFFGETRRATEEAETLKCGDVVRFLNLVRESGDSSAFLLQNLYSTNRPEKQEIPLAIALGKKLLGDCGAVRVHGGGFAGTIQAFVPENKLCEYVKLMESVFGKGSCHRVAVRPCGGVEIKD